jgi:hypothetical protein
LISAEGANIEFFGIVFSLFFFLEREKREKENPFLANPFLNKYFFYEIRGGV